MRLLYKLIAKTFSESNVVPRAQVKGALGITDLYRLLYKVSDLLKEDVHTDSVVFLFGVLMVSSTNLCK